MATRVCNVCEAETPESEAESAQVHSNVRAFWSEYFTYWRCAKCGSLHAKDEVDLGHYYATYPFHNLRDDVLLHTMYGNFLARLRRGGLEKSHRILDYGCGGGHFVKFLRAKGYADVRGFDEYSKDFGDRSVLDDRYDCIVSQDVIEHVPSPHQLLEDFGRLVKPSGMLVIGTPNSSRIDIRRPDDFIHTVHAPYHRHILSRDALLGAGERHGLALARFYPTMYTNTFFPFLNERFYFYYQKLTDGSLDSLMEPIRVGACMVRAPLTLFWGFFGAFFSRGTDMMAVFRKA